MLKLLVFDWDGTLADSVNKIIECKRFLAKQYHLTAPNEETIKNVLGLKFETAMHICFPDASPPLLLQLMKDFNHLMQQDNYQSPLFLNAKNVLLLLKKKYKLAVATSKAKTELDKAILYTDLSGTFDATCCSEEYEGKPLPNMLLHLLEQFKVHPNECIMIGDTTIDILFARNAGVKTICVTFGAHTSSELHSMNPFALIDDWMQLPKIITKIGEKPECYQK